MIKLTTPQKIASAAGVSLLAGIVIGNIISKCSIEKEAIGSLRIDTSEPDEPPYMFLELKTNNVQHIMTQQYVRLKVNTESLLPRK